jgi:glycosyltransferase involved in cell wall biosynthesis
MKKVLIFSLSYYPRFVGGAEVAIKEITDRVSPEEIEFHMVTLRYDSNLPKHEKVGNIFVHRIGFTKKNPTVVDLKKMPLHLNKMAFQFHAFFEAARLHKKYKFEAVWAMMAHSAGVPASLFKAFFPDVHYILTLQEGDPTDEIEKKMRPLRPLFRRAFLKADKVQAISTFLGRWAVKMGYRGTPIIIPNGVDGKLFSQSYSEEELDHQRSALGKKKGDVFLITTSRLVVKNGLKDVISALPLLPPFVRFLIIGVGPEEKALRTHAFDLGVSRRTEFKGFVSHEELPKYLKASDIFVRPSLSEGMGNSFIEAMASGIPVIATQVGGIADFLFDPEKNIDRESTGRAVLPNDPAGIAKAVEAYIGNPATTKVIAHTAQKMALENYDWNLMAKRMSEEVFGIIK